MIIIRTDAQSNRKALAGALSELFHEKPRYCGAPTFAYEFGVAPVAAAFALCRGERSRAAPCRIQIKPRPAALRGAGKAQGIIRLIALHGAARGGKLRQCF